MYPAIRQLWESAWGEFIPFVDYDVETRRIICSTNAIESLDARFPDAVRARLDEAPPEAGRVPRRAEAGTQGVHDGTGL